jgi:hypothetical protein
MPRFGDSLRHILVGHGTVDLDAALIKRVVIADRVNTEFRAEEFNILNHPNFALPHASIGSGVAGIISNTVPIGATGYNREIQSRLRLTLLPLSSTTSSASSSMTPADGGMGQSEH